ncbi:MAG: hypothetical protein M0R06_01600 [Sphaerochaeta sp.]|jgi:hypothetical protein|nr:hypothetical protein [Sphaerochaeta sp.]
MTEPKLVLVEYVDPILIKTKGTVSIDGRVIHGDWYDREKALLGERRGRWRIVRDLPAPVVYETRVMVSDPMTMENMFGQVPKNEYRTKSVKKKRIAWIQDLVMIGGAEISSSEVVRIGRDCGFDIKTVTQKDKPEVIREELRSSHLAVVNNVWSFNPDQIMTILNALYNENIPYVKYEHDHRELGRVDFARPLFQRSRFNVFLSPMHMDNHVKALGCDGICLPLAIETNRFTNTNDGRVEGTALVCNVRHFKKWTNLQRYVDEHPNIRFTVMTNDRMTSIRGDNVSLTKMVDHAEMPAIYNRYEFLVHLLDGLGAGERVVLEAALCGCKVVVNEGVGHASWGKDLVDSNDLREWLNDAPYEFWNKVNEVIR